MNPWAILGAVLASVGAYVWGQHDGRDSENTRWTAKIETERAVAESAARAKEAMWQGVVNGTVKNYESKLAGIRGVLGATLNELQHRPPRAAGVSDGPRPACAGATGAELSGPDARFLAGEAARADEIRAGLAACYSVIDALK